MSATPHVDPRGVTVGDHLPEFARVTSFAEWNRYAAVNDEFIPIHMDDEAARAAGNAAGAFGMGNLRRAYLLNMLHAWAGDDAVVRELSIRYRRINQKGERLRCVGEVVDTWTEGDETLVRIRVDVLDEAGESSTPGEAVVALAPVVS